MSEIDKNYKQTNMLPNKDFALIKTFGVIDQDELEQLVRDISIRTGRNLIIDDEQNVVAYGKDAEYLKKFFKQDLERYMGGH